MEVSETVVWVSDLKYITITAIDRVIIERLNESGERREWYAYPRVDDASCLDIRVYAAHCTLLMALDEVIPRVTTWLQMHGVEAILDEVQVRTEHAVTDEIRQLIEELRSRN